MNAAAVVNVRVAGTLTFPCLRSLLATTKERPVGWLIPPEATAAEAMVSPDVCSVTPVLLPAVAAPRVRPARVMVAVVSAVMAAPAIVMMMLVVVAAAADMVREVTDEAVSVGVLAAKNPEA